MLKLRQFWLQSNRTTKISGWIVASEVLAASGNRGGAIGLRGNGGGVLGERVQCWRSPKWWGKLRTKYAGIFFLTLEMSGHYGLGSWKASVELGADNRQR
jgi:hypothetical protein